MTNLSRDKLRFGHCSTLSLRQGSFWYNWAIQTGSSGYQLHSGEQRARSGNNHTTWPRTLSVCEGACVCVCVCFREVVYIWLRRTKTFVCVMCIKEQLNLQHLPGHFPTVSHTTQQSIVSKSPLFAIRNGWFCHSTAERLGLTYHVKGLWTKRLPIMHLNTNTLISSELVWFASIQFLFRPTVNSHGNIFKQSKMHPTEHNIISVQARMKRHACKMDSVSFLLNPVVF